MRHYYLQWDDPSVWPGRALLATDGRILRFGVGAVNSPDAIWCVFRTELQTVAELRAALGSSQPVDVRVLERAEDGEMMSRQLPLFA